MVAHKLPGCTHVSGEPVVSTQHLCKRGICDLCLDSDNVSDEWQFVSFQQDIVFAELNAMVYCLTCKEALHLVN